MSFSDISSSSVKNGGGRPVAKPQNEIDAAVGRLGDSLQRLQVHTEDDNHRLPNPHKESVLIFLLPITLEKLFGFERKSQPDEKE